MPDIKVTIECKDETVKKLFLRHLCYCITDEALFELDCPDWDGYSGGDDAYFELEDKVVKVELKE